MTHGNCRSGKFGMHSVEMISRNLVPMCLAAISSNDRFRRRQSWCCGSCEGSGGSGHPPAPTPQQTDPCVVSAGLRHCAVQEGLPRVPLLLRYCGKGEGGRRRYLATDQAIGLILGRTLHAGRARNASLKAGHSFWGKLKDLRRLRCNKMAENRKPTAPPPLNVG